jgi:hypothetical protein
MPEANCPEKIQTIHASLDTFAKCTSRNFVEGHGSTGTILDTRMIGIVVIGTKVEQCRWTGAH